MSSAAICYSDVYVYRKDECKGIYIRSNIKCKEENSFCSWFPFSCKFWLYPRRRWNTQRACLVKKVVSVQCGPHSSNWVPQFLIFPIPSLSYLFLSIILVNRNKVFRHNSVRLVVCWVIVNRVLVFVKVLMFWM